jgi:predicted secreted acid phosphatase
MQTKIIEALKPLLKKVENPAAVFDIDETLILNVEDDGYKVHRPVYDVVQFLRKHQVPIFVVTARRKSEASAVYAMEQLYTFYKDEFDGLYMVNKEHDEDDSASIFKFRSRQRVMDKGYTIVLNAGDNWSDLGLMAKYEKHQVHAEWKTTHPSRKKHYLLKNVEETSMLSWKVPNKDYEVD